MIPRQEIQKIAAEYGDDITIGIFGSHSAEEIGTSAKAWGFRTAIIVEERRSELYARHSSHLYDEIIAVKKFKDMFSQKVQDKLIEMNTVFIPNRSFFVYAGENFAERCRNVEEVFRVSMFQNRALLKTEERTAPRNQYDILERSGVRIPKKFATPGEIDRLAIVKVQQAGNPNERAFFRVTGRKDFKEKSEKYLARGIIDRAGLSKARIEEYVFGARFNADFHFYALTDVFGSFDFVGCSDRRQINLQGFLDLPAKDQMVLDIEPTNEEIGHFGVTVRESKKPHFYEVAQKLFDSKVLRNEFPPGIRGYVGIQGAIQYAQRGKKGETEFVVFDLSPRVPGDPAIGPTSPEMRRLSLKYGKKIEAPLDLTMMEIAEAVKLDRLAEVIT
jgi:5-formaminoimidazole-4-carboxamide-1-(beta)-D-ribofuranosyl 5'-monophosphate synthetase